MGPQTRAERYQARLLCRRCGTSAWQPAYRIHRWGQAWRREAVGKRSTAAPKGYVNAFGAITAGQALQQAKAGLEAVYLSGWQGLLQTATPAKPCKISRPVAVRLRPADHGAPHQQHLRIRRADELVGRGIGPG